MNTLNSRRGSPKVAEAVINELGTKLIMEESKLSPNDKAITAGSITYYKKNGFPIFFEKYLRVKYSKLSAWKIEE